MFVKFSKNTSKCIENITCTFCHREQPVTSFRKRSGRPGKYTSHCIECLSKKQSEWRKSPKGRAYDREKKRSAWKHDELYRLRVTLRRRLNHALKGSSVSAVRDLGCSLPDLRSHIESLFKPGMTWNNYGEWEIDHIRPLAGFDLSDPTQALREVHFSNLQPLWKSENRRKGKSGR